MTSLSEPESLLIAHLENASTSGSTPLLSLFRSHLDPFNSLLTANPQSTQNSLTRSLAKQFLPFLNRSLSVLPKRLSDPQFLQSNANGNASPSKSALELLDIYRHCLNCLELVSSQLSCKPWTVHMQRVRLVHCLDACGHYKEAECEGYRILQNIKGLNLGGEMKKTKRKKAKDDEENLGYLPQAMENVDGELARLVVEVVHAIVRCLALRGSKDGGDYKKVTGLVKEVRPWVRMLEADAHDRLHKVFVTYLGKCLLFLAGELVSFDGDIVHAFCAMTLDEYAKLSMKDQLYKFARRICSSLFLLQCDRPSMVTDLLICVLDFLARRCKDEAEEFVELVSYCASKCRTACTYFCVTIGEHFNVLAGDFCQVSTPMDLILRLYATGLSFREFVMKSRDSDVAPSEHAQQELACSICLDEVTVSKFGHVLASTRSYFFCSCKVNGVSCGVKCKGAPNHTCSQLGFHSKTSTTLTEKSTEVYHLLYLKALKFLCEPLAEVVNTQKKKIVSENDASSAPTVLHSILEAFLQFCDISLEFHSTTSDRAGFDESKMITSVAVAAFILSIRINDKLQETVYLIIEYIIASKWIQPQGLKYIFASLYNVGVLLYKNNEASKASKALKLSCKASWSCVRLLCQMLKDMPNGIGGDLSETAIMDFVGEACTRTAFLLDVLYQCDSTEVNKITVSSLENWSFADDLVGRLPGPMPLVKQWVKIGCKLNKTEGNNYSPTLHCLLSSGSTSKKAIGKILYEELLAYEEMDTVYPELCRRMEMKIVNILLEEVYLAQDSCFDFERSRILIRKGRPLRPCGLEGLTNCIQYLSEAISIIKNKLCGRGARAYHQLAVAYSLRALCTQEAEQDSKKVYEDIESAINLWLSIPIPDCGVAFDDCSELPDSALLLLYNIVDLLSMKGSAEFHWHIFKLMISLFKWKNVPLEKCLSLLWDSRRLSHALCVSPIVDEFATNLSGDFGEEFKSTNSWMRCLKGSTTSLIGFQQKFSISCANFCCGTLNHDTSFLSDITVDNVKEAAVELVSMVPVTSCSVFIAGYLYYDLSERLIASGRLFEALSYAKEAHRLRTKLFQEYFAYSIEKHDKKCTEVGDRIQKITYGIQNLQVCRSIAREIWSFCAIPWDVEACYLSPWKVLQCYLESTLQVGMIHEIVGNGVEAETFLLWGKDISCLQSLPLFIAAFSSALGKVYRKKQSWDLSENELQIAKKMLEDRYITYCLKCRLMLKVTVNQQLGDLSRNRVFYSTGGGLDRVSHAVCLYTSALDVLKFSEWKNCVSCPEEVEECAGNAFSCSATNNQDGIGFCSTTTEVRVRMETRKCRKTKNEPKSILDGEYAAEQNKRVTRSRYRSQNQSVNSSAKAQIGDPKTLKGKSSCDFFDPATNKELLLEMKSYAGNPGCETEHICNKMKHLFCLSTECNCHKIKHMSCLSTVVKGSGLLSNFINMKWEFARRRLSLRVLSGIGKCLEVDGKLHEIILQSIFLLVSGNAFAPLSAPTTLTFLLELVGKDLPADIFAVERAALLYDLCWFSLKNLQSNEASNRSNRTICCDQSELRLQKIVSCLMLAFVLCREVPALFQKVSRLLCSVIVLSSSSGISSLPSYCKDLSESHWAFYFHQASLGTHLNYQFLSNVTAKFKAHQLVGDQGLHAAGSTRVVTNNLSRLAPESLQDLENFVKDFFPDLPCTTIICISVIGGSLAQLLQELLLYPSRVSAWLLLSRLNCKSKPVVMLLPVGSILEEDDAEKSGAEDFSGSKDWAKHWHCPWGTTVVDDVAPSFKLILEENYLSSSTSLLEDTKSNRTLWWMRRKKLDDRLSNLLRKIEDSWFGPWRYVLLGERLNCALWDSLRKKLVDDLNSKCGLEINENFLNAILEGAKCTLDESAKSHLFSQNKGCFIGIAGGTDEQRCGTLSKAVEKLTSLAVQLITEAVNELEEEDTISREPVILVLDCEVQMLPWENLPILRDQEVYRMPSVGSIRMRLETSCCHHQDQGGSIVPAFPLIDPLDAFYLLNPSGDLCGTQVEFENWFRDQDLEGKAGSAPTAEELATALKSHDLFIYFGHGSGAQYIPQQEIQKLEKCAATLLMGCSSGSLSLNGSYVPQGAPLSYLLAGSPVIVANLWDVTDKDIDRFGKAMLNAWLRERSTASIECPQCSLLVEKFEAMNVRGRKGNAAKKKVQKKRASEACDRECLKHSCDHRPRIGSFMGKAREVCTLPFLIGASPVCYGVPTGIRRRICSSAEISGKRLVTSKWS